MNLTKLSDRTLDAFLAFCRKHRRSVDDSYLEDEDLASFSINEMNPTFVELGKDGKVVSAASLIIDQNNQKGRFRIFHSETADIRVYQEMLEAMLTVAPSVKTFSVFGEESRKEFFTLLTNLGFELERYIIVMDRYDTGAEIEATLPDGYAIREFIPGVDEEVYQQIRNTAFDGLVGNSPISVEFVREMQNWYEHVREGFLLLTFQDEPIGGIRMTKHPDEDTDSFVAAVEPICILPTHQGRGLGRQLLRAGLKFAQQIGLSKCYLCVNATNERAADLYAKEGFIKTEVVLCWNYIRHKD